MIRRILNWLPWRRRRMERDLARELRHHVDRRVEDLMHTGVSEAAAKRQASIELGGVPQVQENVRDAWIWPSVDDVARDIRIAGRSLRRAPTFTTTAMMSIALGIGASAAIFSLVDQVLLRTLPVKDPQQLVLLSWKGNPIASQYGFGSLLSYPLCRDVQRQTAVFSGAFCRHPTRVSFSAGDRQDFVPAEIVSGSYFPVLGVQPWLGRLIDESDDVERGANPVVVISYEFWKTRLGGAADVIGRRMSINKSAMVVIGVAPPTFHGVDIAAAPAVWIPVTMTPQADIEIGPEMLKARVFWMQVFARLAPSVTVERARAGLQPWFKSNLDVETRLDGFPVISADQRARFLESTLELEPAARGWSALRGLLGRPLWVLLGGTLLLLMLASLNVAGLLLARGAARGRELRTRLALGASRARLAGQLLSESILITVGGGLLGVVLAPIVARTLLSFVSRDADLSAHVDRRVLLLTMLVSLGTGLLCGLAPVFQTGRISLIASLKEKTRIGGGIRLRKALVIGQMAFALILLIGAGLFVQTLVRLYAQGPGFASTNLVMFRLNPRSAGYAQSDAERVMQDLSHSLATLPGVERASLANTDVLGGGRSSTHLTVQADTRTTTDRPVSYMRVTSSFFATLGVSLLAGREFDRREVRVPGAGSVPSRAVIVNERFAKRYFGDESPVGKRIGLGNRPNATTDIEIVGVVSDFNRSNLREQSEMVFFPFWDRDSGDGVFYLRTRGPPAGTFAAIRQTVARVDRGLPLGGITTFQDQIDQSLANERMLALLSSGFGAIALMLAVVGLFGVMSFAVTSRTREIGVRLALGATPANAMWLVVRDALGLIAAAAVTALGSAMALTRLIESQLFGVRALDAPTMAAATAVLAIVALASAMIPAWRAASVSPVEAMRSD